MIRVFSNFFVKVRPLNLTYQNQFVKPVFNFASIVDKMQKKQS